MTEEYNHLNQEERVKAENDFLKMKIMIEHGGEFFSGEDNVDISTEFENDFLNHVIEFEKQFSSRRTVTIFKKIGSPQHFKPEKEIPDDEVEQAWENLSEYMSKYGVELSACSPRVTARELYRFTTEELFQHETDDINIAGMMTGFIYDEFYPDHEYDNTRTATEDCIRRIFCTQLLEWTHNFADQLRFNDYPVLANEDFKKIVNRFKDAHDEIDLNDLAVDSSRLEEKYCMVKGNYRATAKVHDEIIVYEGEWLIDFVFDSDFDFWQISNVQIGGLTL